jgi:hypothetical protein
LFLKGSHGAGTIRVAVGAIELLGRFDGDPSSSWIGGADRNRISDQYGGRSVDNAARLRRCGYDRRVVDGRPVIMECFASRSYSS